VVVMRGTVVIRGAVEKGAVENGVGMPV